MKRCALHLWLLLALFMMGTTLALAHGDEEHDDDAIEDVAVPAVSVPDELSYHEHIRPIIEASCVSCHSDGNIAAYAPLDEPFIAVAVASDIDFHVRTRLMPPWPPSRDNLPLKDDRSLSDYDIALIAAWAEAGAPLGNSDDYVPSATEAIDFTEIRADLTLQLAEPYVPDEELLDDYRCFAFELGIESPQYITGYDIAPEALGMAHHAIAYLLDASAWRLAEAKDGGDGRPGWPCYGGHGLRHRATTIAGWTPGSFAVAFPPGKGYRIEPGQFIVLQMHYNLSAAWQPDNTRILLQLEDGDAELDKLTILPLTAPVEIPCPSDYEGPAWHCERNTALTRVGELYGNFARHFPSYLLRECGQRLADYADNTGEAAYGHCDFPVTHPATLYAVLGHMHELGRSFRLELNPESHAPLLLLDIPRWDFHWQGEYQLAQPLELARGDTVRMTCVWDNTLSDAPRYVVWGEGTSDEMCFGTLLVELG